ncbi:MAG: hypothetical protein ACJ78Q_19785 [Chloroflexia bacterium]
MAMPQRLSGEPESQESPQALEVAPDIDAIAGLIRRSGMAGVVSVLIDAGRPLAWVGGQALWALQPFVGAIGGRRSPLLVGGIARLLEREGFAEDLIERLNRPGADSDARS